MEKFGLLRRVCVIFVVGAAALIASPAQTLTTLHNFAFGNEGAYSFGGS